mmetsp:Transcript_12049/g.30879  ORF Transcript_12049/g.30879 Transcript_12049/m.30879 type:complete len:246 (-) Transcript_12049:20-757(-)
MFDAKVPVHIVGLGRAVASRAGAHDVARPRRTQRNRSIRPACANEDVLRFSRDTLDVLWEGRTMLGVGDIRDATKLCPSIKEPRRQIALYAVRDAPWTCEAAGCLIGAVLVRGQQDRRRSSRLLLQHGLGHHSCVDVIARQARVAHEREERRPCAHLLRAWLCLKPLNCGLEDSLLACVQRVSLKKVVHEAEGHAQKIEAGTAALKLLQNLLHSSLLERHNAVTVGQVPCLQSIGRIKPRLDGAG